VEQLSDKINSVNCASSWNYVLEYSYIGCALQCKIHPFFKYTQDLHLIIELDPLKISTPLRTQTQLDTMSTYIDNMYKLKEEPSYISVLQN
jgi:hypothetical protein